MTRTFIQTTEFSNNWDRLGFTDDDLRQLELTLLKKSNMCPVMKGTGGLRKLRFAFPNSGVRGGVRVCYVDFVLEETIYLITVYSKNEKANLTNEERNNIKRAIELLKLNLNQGV